MVVAGRGWGLVITGNNKQCSSKKISPSQDGNARMLEAEQVDDGISHAVLRKSSGGDVILNKEEKIFFRLIRQGVRAIKSTIMMIEARIRATALDDNGAAKPRSNIKPK